MKQVFLSLLLLSSTLPCCLAQADDDDSAELPEISTQPRTVDPALLVPDFLTQPLTFDLSDSSLQEMASVLQEQLVTPVLFDTQAHLADGGRSAAGASGGCVRAVPTADAWNRTR